VLDEQGTPNPPQDLAGMEGEGNHLLETSRPSHRVAPDTPIAASFKRAPILLRSSEQIKPSAELASSATQRAPS
jgi:hypothetical protein